MFERHVASSSLSCLLCHTSQANMSCIRAFRLINEGADDMPGLTVDVYGAYAVVRVQSRHWLSHIPTIAQVR